MEKNQHNNNVQTGSQQSGHQFRESQPGQELPSNAKSEETEGANPSEKSEHHSASSFPQQDNETLGTP